MAGIPGMHSENIVSARNFCNYLHQMLLNQHSKAWAPFLTTMGLLSPSFEILDASLGFEAMPPSKDDAGASSYLTMYVLSCNLLTASCGAP